jgi:hypothetical protein
LDSGFSSSAPPSQHLFSHRLCTVICLLALACIPSSVHAQSSAITQPRNVVELSTLADRIVQGKVSAVSVERHPDYRNLMTLLITVSVEDVLKGAPAKTVTFRQFLWDPRDVADAGGYRAGEGVLLFLNRPTSLGLTSPVGLGQGRFHIVRGQTAELKVVNDNGNSNLFRDVNESRALKSARLSTQSRTLVQNHTSGPITLTALKEVVRGVLQNGGQTR